MTHPVERLVAMHPLAPERPLRADEIGRTPGATLHLVQVRTQEAPHQHATHDLVVTTVLGKGELHVGDHVVVLGPGDVAMVPRGTPHWFANTGRTPAVALVTFVPALDEPDAVPVPEPVNVAPPAAR